VAARRAAKDLVPLLALAHVAGAGVDADDQVGRGVAQALEGVGGVVGAVVVPAVLAHQQAHLRAANAQHLGHVWPGLEVAALVEDVVGGQQLLGVLQAHGAALQHQQAVVQALARACGGRGRAHHPVQRGQLGRCLLQRRQAVLHTLQEGRLVQHVAGVVAAQCELAEHDEVRLLAGGLLGGGHHAGHVALDVANGEIQLGDGDAEHVSFSLNASGRVGVAEKLSEAVLARRSVADSTGGTARLNNDARRVFSATQPPTLKTWRRYAR